jgi:hypothetical protein
VLGENESEERSLVAALARDDTAQEKTADGGLKIRRYNGKDEMRKGILRCAQRV